MPEDIDKIVDDVFEEMDTLVFERQPEVETWTVIGFDAESEDIGELEAVIEALETTRSEPWYEKLNRELSK